MPNAEDHATQTSASDADFEHALRADLQRRIAALADTSDDAFGRIGLADGILVAALFVVVPALVAWMFR
jgi:hypothetical protein